MQVSPLSIAGPKLIHPEIHGDSRGWFVESFKDAWFRREVADVSFVQENHSYSANVGTVRGLHAQRAPWAQGKLVKCIRGAIYDVVVDVRTESAWFGRWVGVTLTAEDRQQLWVPDGFLHGFCTLQPDTEVMYKITAPYSPEHEFGVRFDDPDLAIDWPVQPQAAILSLKDRGLPSLASMRAAEKIITSNGFHAR